MWSAVCSSVCSAVRLRYMCGTREVYVHYMCRICAVYVQYMCSTCAVHVQYQCSPSALQVHYKCSAVVWVHYTTSSKITITNCLWLQPILLIVGSLFLRPHGILHLCVVFHHFPLIRQLTECVYMWLITIGVWFPIWQIRLFHVPLFLSPLQSPLCLIRSRIDLCVCQHSCVILGLSKQVSDRGE